ARTANHRGQAISPISVVKFSFCTRLELKVQTAPDDIPLRLPAIVDSERRIRCAIQTFGDRRSFIAQIIIEILRFYGPMMADGVLDSAARSPACFGCYFRNGMNLDPWRCSGSINKKAVTRLIDIAISESARAVYQQPAPRHISNSAARRSKPLHT